MDVCWIEVAYDGHRLAYDVIRDPKADVAVTER